MSRIFIGGLPEDASRTELEREFEYLGRLRDVWVARNPPGFGFIIFEDARDADDAVREMDGKRVCGQRIRVEYARGPTRGSGRGSYGGRSEVCRTCGRFGHSSRECRSMRSNHYSDDGYSRSSRRSRSRSRSRDRYRDSRRRRSRSRSRDRERSSRYRSRSRDNSKKYRSRSGERKRSRSREQRSHSKDNQSQGQNDRSRSRSRSSGRSKEDQHDSHENKNSRNRSRSPIENKDNHQNGSSSRNSDHGMNEANDGYNDRDRDNDEGNQYSDHDN